MEETLLDLRNGLTKVDKILPELIWEYAFDAEGNLLDKDYLTKEINCNPGNIWQKYIDLLELEDLPHLVTHTYAADDGDYKIDIPVCCIGRKSPYKTEMGELFPLIHAKEYIIAFSQNENAEEYIRKLVKTDPRKFRICFDEKTNKCEIVLPL